MFSVKLLQSSEQHLIKQAAQWYLSEWNIPVERTMHRLSTQAGDDILFQFMLFDDELPVATGGLYVNVGLFREHEYFRQYQPWVAVLYTIPTHRKQGLGGILLNEIEKKALSENFKTVYLYTSTAESLYLKNGYMPMERVIYQGKENVVMVKHL